MKNVTCQELKNALESDSPPLLLDVLSDQHFEREHIKGAQNACIYEVVFLETVEKMANKKNSSIVVYGLNDNFSAASQAFQQLTENGYTNVSVLAGGLDNWRTQGLPVHQLSESKFRDSETFYIDTEKSIVRWTGRNLVNQHTGELKVESGHMKFENGALQEATVISDFESLTCTDIPEGKMNQGLIAHLKSPDFFEADKYPKVRFQLNGVRKIEGATSGRPNHNVSGELEMRGLTNPIEFEAIITRVDSLWVVQANLDVDRTRWGSRYGSGRFFEALGKHLVNDHISLQIQLFSK